MENLNNIKEAIKFSLPVICEESVNFTEVIVNLYSKNIISQHESDEAKNLPSDYERFFFIYTQVIKKIRQENTYPALITALEKSGNEHIIKILSLASCDQVNQSSIKTLEVLSNDIVSDFANVQLVPSSSPGLTISNAEVPSSDKIEIDIGISISQHSFKIGYYQNQNQIEQELKSTGTFKELLCIPPEIYFSNNIIYIGEAAKNLHLKENNKSNRHHFNIFEILTSYNENQFKFGSKKHGNFCGHQIVAAFFQKAFKDINIQMENVGKIVVTIPSIFKTLTVIETIKNSLQIVHCKDKDVIIFSTNYGLILAMEEQKKENKKKCKIFKIVESRDRNNPQSKVELSPSMHLLIIDGQLDFIFLQVVESFTGQQFSLDKYFVKDIEKDKLYKIVEGAIDQLISILHKDDSGEEFLLLISECTPQLIWEIVEQVLNRKTRFVVKGSIVLNPCLGASLFSVTNSAKVSGILPPNIGIEDTSLHFNYDYVLTTDFGFENKETVTDISYSTSQLFSISIKSICNGPLTFNIQLYYRLKSYSTLFTICRYKLTLEWFGTPAQRWSIILSKQNPLMWIKIKRSRNKEGVWQLEAKSRSEVAVLLTMKSVDNFNCCEGSNCKDLNNQELKRMIELYEI